VAGEVNDGVAGHRRQDGRFAGESARQRLTTRVQAGDEDRLGFGVREQFPFNSASVGSAAHYAYDTNIQILRLTAKALGQVFTAESSNYFLLLGTTLFLVLLGLVMVLSSSSIDSFTERQGFFGVFWKQGLFALIGIGSGLLGGSLCVHYNNEPERRAAYLDAVAGGIPGGYGLDDYAGLLWEGTGPPSAITARRGARAYRVTGSDTGVVESPLPARFLPAPAPAALREDIAEFRRIKSMRRRAGWLG